MNDLEALSAEFGHSRQVGVGDELSNYEKFLEALLKGKHPPFCELVWTGDAFHIVLQLHFQKTPPAITPSLTPEAQTYRREAWSRFRRVGPAQQGLMHIRVSIKNWLPVTAEVTVRPEAVGIFRLGTTQLAEFQKP